MNRLILLVIAGMMSSAELFAQSGNLVGKIVNQADRTVVPFGSVQLSKDGKTVGSATADIDGKYKLENIPCGIYTLKVHNVGYDSLLITDVTIDANRKLIMNLEVLPKQAQYAEIIPIPLYIPKEDSLKLFPPDSSNQKALPKKTDRLQDKHKKQPVR